MRRLASAVTVAFIVLFSSACWATPPQCAGDAIIHAKKLLNFHVGGDDRIQIDPDVKELPSIRNPADKRQSFQVLEVWGYIYKGRYCMRLIYYHRGNDCVLMGQEVLEHAKL